MAVLLDPAATADRRAASLLIPLKVGLATQPPLFFVHPSGGSVFPYRDLAAALPDGQTIYGVQSPALDGTTEPYRDIETMARRYLQEIRGVQPHGPYYLGGHSSGGSVAYEMAQQLTAIGEQVETLFLCDAVAPGRRPAADDETAVAKRLEAWRQSMPSLAHEMSSGSEHARLFHRITLADVEALHAYTPQPYGGRVVYCRAMETVADFPSRPDEGWRTLVTGEMVVHDVPGNHWTMMQHPHVQLVAALLSAHVTDAAAVNSLA
jgi:thioesterase domain-containing protein